MVPESLPFKHVDFTGPCLEITYAPQADLEVQKSSSGNQVAVGEDLTYTINVINHGPNDAEGVEVNDPLPAGLSYVSSTATKGSYNASTGVWAIGTLAQGTSATLTIVVQAQCVGNCSGSITNEVSVSADTYDPNTDNNAATVTTTVVDTTPPTLTVPADVTIECDESTDPSSTGQATATDNCCNSSNIDISYTDSVSQQGCCGSKVITRTWTATDACGNTTTGTQKITVVDTTPPVITVQAQDKTVECDGQGNTDDLNAWLATHGGAVAKDACCDVTWTNDYSSQHFVSGNCPGTGHVDVTFTASDECGNSNTTSARFTIVDTTPPIAQDDSATTKEDTPVLIDVLANDSDLCSPNLTIISVGSSGHGSATIVNEEVKYTPDSNYNGVDHFTYTIEDCSGNQATATVTVAVAVVNDPPVANDDSYTTNEDTQLNVSAPGVLGNDSDPDGDSLTVSSYDHTTVQGGTVSMSTNGSFTYTPAANYCGADSFTYTISDGHGGTDSATVHLTVNCVNDPPVAEDDSDTTNEDTPVTTNVVANDHDIDGTIDPTTVAIITGPAHGTVVNNGDGTVTYTPDTNFNGVDTYTYTVNDNDGATSNVATVAITVIAVQVNRPPVAADDNAVTDENTAVTIPVLANDSDPDGDTITVTDASVPTHGTTAVNPNGTITYTPDSNYCGQDAFTYAISDGRGGTDTALVSVTVNCVNNPPVALDDTTTTDQDTAVTIDVLGNDSDPDGTLNPTTVSINTPPSNGSVVVNSDGTVTYHPDPGFSGVDTFTYTVNDNDGLTSNVATVSITVASIGADISVTKTADNLSPNEGDTVTFTIVLTNNGPDDATGVTMTDLLPTGITYSTDTSGGTYNPATGIWTVGTLAAGASATLTITATVNTGTGGTTITNTASVTADQPDPNTANNSSSVSLTVAEVAGGGGAATEACEGKVVINEVAWAGTAASPQDEWIELRNLGTTPVDLTGWTIRWRKKNPVTPEDYRWKVVDLSGTLLPARTSACELAGQEGEPSVKLIKRPDDNISWLVVGETKKDDTGYFLLERRSDKTVSDIKAGLVYDTTPPYSLSLDDDGDVIELLNAQGEVVDTANASPEPRSGWPAGDATIHATMERIDPLKPDTPDNWHTNMGIITYGLDANGRPLVATADLPNADVLDELSLESDVTPVKTRPGARLEVGIDLPRDARKSGWPWIRVTRPGVSEAAGGGGSVIPYSFSSRYVHNIYWLGIDTSELPPGEYNFWIVYGEGKVVLVPVKVLP